MIYVLIGTPDSGKSTFARTMVRYMNAVIVSRDSLREMLHGYTPDNVAAYYDREDINSLEKTVSTAQDGLVKQALKAGKNVILDNTHLRLKYINELKKYNVPLKFILNEVDFETALTRDQARVRQVGESFLRKSFEELEHLKKVFDFKDWYPEETTSLFAQNHNPANLSAFVFDIDGTLAKHSEKGRSPYDYSKVIEDVVNDPVKRVYDTIEDYGYPIVICSGRPEEAREDTEKWLENHGIMYDRLYMRKSKDNRKDYVVKEEMWRDILKSYNIVAMLDDRTQVVEHARKLGFTVFQVDEGNF